MDNISRQRVSNKTSLIVSSTEVPHPNKLIEFVYFWGLLLEGRKKDVHEWKEEKKLRII